MADAQVISIQTLKTWHWVTEWEVPDILRDCEVVMHLGSAFPDTLKNCDTKSRMKSSPHIERLWCQCVSLVSSSWHSEGQRHHHVSWMSSDCGQGAKKEMLSFLDIHSLGLLCNWLYGNELHCTFHAVWTFMVTSMLQHWQVQKQTRQQIYNTLALPTLMCGSETSILKEKRQT